VSETDAESRPYRRITDPAVMRALAHPARFVIVEYLNDGHVATATECAEVCGLTPSATSYHLRALARAGLVEEAPSRGDGRERVWRSAAGGLDVRTDSADPPETTSAALELLTVVLARDDEQTRQWFARSAQEPKEWYDAVAVLRNQIVLTADELTDLVRAVTALLAPFSRQARPEPPAGARRVGALFRAIPVDELIT
jgi:DNA-binding transcriptional ArsR family regulator